VAFPHVRPFPWKETVLELTRCPHPFHWAHSLILLFIPGFGFGEGPGFFDNPIHIQLNKWYLAKAGGESGMFRTYQKFGKNLRCSILISAV
jgi:hypothetical protein